MALKHYKNSDSTVFNDAKALFDLNKNILLKGPTGSGKTKLAETLSEVVDTPMHQVNCSVDLDTESLLGFKTIKTNAEGQQEIVFVDGPVIDGDILKNVIKEQSLLQDDKQIEQIIKFNEDLRTMSKQGQISEEAASIRALLDLCDLITVMPVERAIKRTIIDKLEDEREQQAIYNAVELNF